MNGKYGKLIYLDNIECPICLEVKRCVKFLKCPHYVCISDFKRMFYGKEVMFPPFPYPELLLRFPKP